MREAIEVAHRSDASVALTMSDPFCVQHHRTEFLELLDGDLELLFANEEEVMMLFGASSFDAAADAVAETGVLAVLTRGASGLGHRHRLRRDRGAHGARRTGSSTPRGRATCLPPASSTASPTA